MNITWTLFLLHQTPLDIRIAIHDRLITGHTAIWGDCIPGTIAANAGLVAFGACTVIRVFRERTGFHTEFGILDIVTGIAVIGIRSIAPIQTFRMAIATSIRIDLINSGKENAIEYTFRRKGLSRWNLLWYTSAVSQTGVLVDEILAFNALGGSDSPAASIGTLL